MQSTQMTLPLGTDPRVTVDLLKRLCELGFDNREFRVVHHFADASLMAHVSYCKDRVTSFKTDDTNAKVQARLGLVLRSYERSGFASAANRKAVLLALACAAVAEVPK